MIDWDPNRPRWEQIVDLLVARIDAGELLPGDRLPGIHDLMQTYGVANSTAQKVLRGLRDRGYAHTVMGMGTYVSARQSEGQRPTDQP